MNTKDLKEWFKKIPKYKKLIGNYKDCIAYYKDCLNSEDKLMELVRVEEEKLAVQRSRTGTAPQAVIYDLKCYGRKKAEEEIQKYKNKRNSLYRKLYLLDKSLEYIEEISKEKAYIIECKYISNLDWNNVEINFNNRFRKYKTLGGDRIRHIASDGLKEMVEYIDSIPADKIDYSHTFKIDKLKVDITYDIKQLTLLDECLAKK